MWNPIEIIIKIITAKVISESKGLYGEYAVLYQELENADTVSCLEYLWKEFTDMWQSKFL